MPGWILGHPTGSKEEEKEDGMVRREAERLAEKTAERQFLYEMETDFELAPAASRAVLETAQQVLLLAPSRRPSHARRCASCRSLRRQRRRWRS